MMYFIIKNIIINWCISSTFKIVVMTTMPANVCLL